MKKIFLIIAFFVIPQISFADTLAQDFYTPSGYNIGYSQSQSDGAPTFPKNGNFFAQSWVATSTYRLSKIETTLQRYGGTLLDGYVVLNLYEASTTLTYGAPDTLDISTLTPIATSTAILGSSIPGTSCGYGQMCSMAQASTTAFTIPYGVNVIAGHNYIWTLRHILGGNTSAQSLMIGWQYFYYGNLGTGGVAYLPGVSGSWFDTLYGDYYFRTYQSSTAPDSLTLTAPYPQTYIQNPITFIGSYHAETICYKEITVEVQSITQNQTLVITPFSFHSCPANPDQTFSFDRTLPYTGQYRARVKLTAFSDADSLPWSPWHEFDLGQVGQNAPFTPQGWTPETCDTLDLPCHIRNAFGVTFYPSVTSQETLSSTLSTDNLKYRFPLGYVTDFVTIISTSTESSLVVVDATLPSVLPGGGAHIRIDLSHILDPVLNATSTIFNNASAPSTQTFYEITSHYWNIVLYLAVVFYVIARIVGSHIVPDLGHMNTDTQDLRAKSFSEAEAERYRYKESLYKNSYQGRGGYGPFLSDKNKLR